MAENDERQPLIAFRLDARLGSAVEKQRKLKGLSRSQFVRDAILEKLANEGIQLPHEVQFAPERARMDFAAEGRESKPSPAKKPTTNYRRGLRGKRRK